MKEIQEEAKVALGKVQADTWERRENLKNAQEAIKEFEKEYQRDMEDVAQQECKAGTF